MSSINELWYAVTRYGVNEWDHGFMDLDEALLDCYGDILAGHEDAYIVVVELGPDPVAIDEITTEEVVERMRRYAA